jgi:hypothetical protein
MLRHEPTITGDSFNRSRGTRAATEAQRDGVTAGRDALAGTWVPLTAAAWLQAYNSTWLDGRWPELETLLATDVEFALLGVGRVVAGRSEVVAMLRRRYARLAIHDFSATELDVRQVGGIGIVAYRWYMDWHDSQNLTREFGRTAIGVRLLQQPWKALWIKEVRG